VKEVKRVTPAVVLLQPRTSTGQVGGVFGMRTLGYGAISGQRERRAESGEHTVESREQSAVGQGAKGAKGAKGVGASSLRNTEPETARPKPALVSHSPLVACGRRDAQQSSEDTDSTSHLISSPFSTSLVCLRLSSWRRVPCFVEP
jgi:hypothetical protein